MKAVYFSDLLPIKYPEDWRRIESAILSHTEYQISLLKNTKDIWCRDYMPVRNATGGLIQFRYEPSYLNKYQELQSNPLEVLKANGIDAKYSNINLDGGNVIIHGEKAVITDRVVIENPEYSNKYKLFQEVEELLKAELIVMPAHKPANDMTGHIDGMMRFVDEQTLIGNDLDNEFDSMADSIRVVLKENGLEYIPMPFYEDKSTPISALGIYVNYLELEDTILFPVFGQNDNDDKALEVMIDTFPAKEIVPININTIARSGGLANCISWIGPCV